MLINRESGTKRNRILMDEINLSFGNIYSQSAWLDIVCSDWELLWDSNFQNFLAVPVYKKLKLIKAVQQPFFTQQLGLVGPNSGNSELQKAFIDTLLKHYPLGIYHFNNGNVLNESHLTLRTNLILPLTDYQLDNLDGHHQRNIKKATKHGLAFKLIEADDLVSFYFEHNPQSPTFSEELKYQGKSIVHLLNQHGNFLSLAAVDNLGNIQSCLGLGFFRNRAYCLFNTSTTDARKIGAGHWLFAEAFQLLNNKEIEIFDFEGSEIPGVAKFFEGFGAIPEPYAAIKWGKGYWKMANLLRN